MRRKPHPLLGLTAALAALALSAGAAAARPLNLRLPDAGPAPLVAVPLAGEAIRPEPDLADPLDPLARPKVQTQAMDDVVFAKTAVDHRFAGRDNLTGSLGFLCGLQPGHNEAGGAAAYGVDPHGRFVGAKLSIAFR